MDIFHTITQELENVLSCHWLDEFRTSHRSRASTPGASRSQSATPGDRGLQRSASSSSNLSAKSATRSSRSSSVSEAVTATLGGSAVMSPNNTTKMMDTEPGGESTQYESIQTVTKPHSKESGQLGDDAAGTTTDTSGVDPDRAQKTAENIRYGQNVSESGMGGMTTTSTGTANQEGGHGGTEAQRDLEESGNGGSRAAQQYSAGKNVHDEKVGG